MIVLLLFDSPLKRNKIAKKVANFDMLSIAKGVCKFLSGNFLRSHNTDML